MFSENLSSQKEKQFHQLHHNGEPLVLPNIWNTLGARLLEELGYKAIATASASIAFSNGYDDGQKIPFDELLFLLKKIVKNVKIPVSADIESGYAKSSIELRENIKKLIDTGISGINFEDSLHDESKLFSKEEQSEKINLIKKTASENRSNLFINARTDVFIKENKASKEEKLTEAIERGKAYKNAGADSFYPIFLKEKEGIETIVKEVSLPVNILMVSGIPDFSTLKEIGVSRISLGPGFLKYAINSMKNIAEKLLKYQGMEEIISNPVTSDYLKNLSKNKDDGEKN
ncbi:MAG TPA: isocitrate lyase/phosphoenolpyruvate mutase family protein [Hanamia sp.]|nr:isocitrate lyase/phosphoenolpyruvate mutase family protein [Hanamia sp.]